MRIAAPVVGPVWLIFLRVGLAGLALSPLLLRADVRPHIRNNISTLFFIGILNSALPFLCFAFASVYLPAGFTAILNATAPLFGTVIAAVWLREKTTPAQAIGFVLGFVGVVLLVGRSAQIATSTLFYLAVAAALLASLMYAIAAPIIRTRLAGVPAIGIAAGSQLGAAVFLLVFIPFFVPDEMPNLTVIGSIVALALASTALAYILYFRLIQNIGSSRALTVTYLIPVFAMIWGALFLGEAITGAMLIGCALILLGTAIANGLIKR